MNQRLIQALENHPDQYILPFFWQHGEDAALLREGMQRIRESGIGAVCIESRPHPDFLGEKWWHDLDTILDEAKRLEMKVWILDDAHFPSGMCNGKITADSPYGKDYLTHVYTDIAGPLKGHAFMVYLRPGEKLLGVVLGRIDRKRPDLLTDLQDLTACVADGKVYVDIPEGTWSLMVLKTTRQGTGRKNYINAIDRDAVRHLHDTALDTLQFVAGTRHLEQQEIVHHRVRRRLRLTHTDGLQKDGVETRCFAEHDCLARLACHAAERTCTRAGADEGVRLDGQFVHTRLIAEDRAFAAFGRRVDSQHGEFLSRVAQLASQGFDEGGLAGAGHTRDSDADGVAGVG